MEKSWKISNLCLGLLYCELCNGLPINLENTVADSHTQLLTGLVAVLLTVCSVVFLAGCLCCQRKNGFKEFRDSPVVASTASNLDHGHINPVANGEFTIFTPLSPPHQNNNVFLANQQIITRTQEDYVCGDVDVSSWFAGSETDFPRIKLKYIKEIGKGWFGRVVEGAAQDIKSDQKWTPVVVRILEATASSRERVVFLHDAAIYRCGAHPNILKLFGRCLDTIPLLLLQEYCPQGDLKNYLLQNKPTADKLLSSEYPLVWCCQLGSALKHLHENRLIHPDLAARNCQLTSNLTLKLGDYGLAVFQYPEDYYQGAPGVPVRWCAPETLTCTSTTIQPKKITAEANIWSFAVTMWEICECGEQPYPALSDDEVISQVLGAQNVRLARPKYQVLYTDYVFRLMQLCWTGSESRPAMSQIDLMLGDLLQVYKNTSSASPEPSSVSMKDFDRRWEAFKPNRIVKTDNHEAEIASSKPLSPSLNNLHGSLDNLAMESWLENVATRTGDMSFVKGLSDAIKDLDNAIALENSTSSDSSPAPKAEFKLGPLAPDSPDQNDSLTDSSLFVARSSESETEEENWKRKIERGAYSEKVRQKSRSVADLMVLTHIDPSESESETPLPSLDYRANYRNVRYAPKLNLENAGLMFGSEGNLLNVQETFQDELKKLQEERRDSLLFVPENCSQNDSSSENLLSDSAGHDAVNVTSSVSAYLEDSPSKRLLQELNSTSEIKPANQVFNVFNVTIDKFSPVHLKPKLNEFIHFNEGDDDSAPASDVHGVPKLADIVQSNSELISYLSKDDTFEYVKNDGKSLSDGECDNSEVMYDSGVEGDRMESTESLKNPSEEKLDELQSENDVIPPQSGVVHAENIHIKRENDTLYSERELALPESNVVQLENDVVQSESELARSENHTIQSESELLQLENDTLTPENNTIRPETESDVLSSEKQLKRSENNTVKSENEVVRLEDDGLLSESNMVQSKSELARLESNILTSEEPLARSENNGLSSESNRLQSENNTEKSESEVVRLENDYLSSEANTVQSKSELARLENDIVTSEKQLARSENNSLSSESNRLQSENELARIENDVSCSEMQLARSENNGLSSENELARIESDVLSLEMQLTRSENNTAKSESEVARLENDSLSSESILVPSKSELARLESDIVTSEEPLARSDNNGLSSESNRLQSENNTEKSESEVEGLENDDLSSEANTVQSKSGLARLENDIVTSEKQLARSENNGLSSESDRLQSENELARIENDVSCSEMQLTRSENDGLSSESNRLQSGNNTVKSESKVVRLENDGLSSEANMVQSKSQLARLENDIVTSENNGLSSESNRLQSENELARIENDVSCSEMQLTRSENDGLSSESNRLQSGNNTVKSESKVVRLENDDLSSEANMVQSKSQLARLENDIVTSEKQLAQSENNGLSSESNRVQSENEWARIESDVSSSEMQLTRLENNGLSSESKTLRSENNMVQLAPAENDLDDVASPENEVELSESVSIIQNLHITSSLPTKTEQSPNRTYQVPKLVDLIQDNDELMDYIITRYETESMGKMDDSLDSLEMYSEKKCEDFLDEEIRNCEDPREPKVAFDLSEDQDEAMPNSLTHSSVFTSTPFSKRSLQELPPALPHQDGFCSLNLFENATAKDQKVAENNSALYSLETWDNFLGKALDNQNESQANELFDSFSSEPQSLLFTENEILVNDNRSEDSQSQETRADRTYVCDEKKNQYTVDINDINVELECPSKHEDEVWESNGGGWFLHPQSDISGEMTISPIAVTDSYVGFNVDDEIMAAIRNELLNKLPQAQGGSNGAVHDEEEWDSADRNEVFLRYNVYNTPLSPIPEESHFEDNSCELTPRQHSEDENDDSDWSDHCDGEALQHESPIHHEPLHRHTPSQDSCCSNDTLFNLEELTCAVNDTDRDNGSPNIPKISSGESHENLSVNEAMSHGANNESTDADKKGNVGKGCDTTFEISRCVGEPVDKRVIIDFLANERQHGEESTSESTTDHLLFINKQVAPLPSPEDKPWKQLPASLLSYDTVISQNMLANVVPETQELAGKDAEVLYANVLEKDSDDQHEYENVESYEIATNIDDFYNEADYVNIVNLENTKNSANNKQVDNEKDDDRDSPEFVEDYNQQNQLIISNEEDRDIFGVLTDIRFSGPADSQLMTTSFSESNDLNDEQDWDSGSDTRSSSSGEFIWKEGEHEESLKALRAAPQDVLEDIQPMEEIQEETSSESSSSSSDDDGESPEFVPSAWDKYATPTKSALRSPEKTLEKSEKKKSKGVWFKKQKYHCVYEYPREPDSPVLHSYDLWKAQPDYSSFDDWELDGADPYVATESSDDFEITQNYYQPKSNRNLNVYHLSSIADFASSDCGADDEFFISSSAKPFDMIGGLSCQFFPGNWTENATPDSGVEDITPDFVPRPRGVQTLKQLASEAAKRGRKAEDVRSGDVLGGLRHTRNKLKLDLPPSPSAFTSNRMFSIEPVVDPVITREKPTFTTFGKSRFLVQHVDTPPDDEASRSKNVSFEALPYKPMQKHVLKEDYDTNSSKGKVEIVRGEASLLDSADEDSGIESSTLERKLSNAV